VGDKCCEELEAVGCWGRWETEEATEVDTVSGIVGGGAVVAGVAVEVGAVFAISAATGRATALLSVVLDFLVAPADVVVVVVVAGAVDVVVVGL
jgi:hypothetical protein